MSKKFGFLSVMEEECEKALEFDFSMDWQKRNHAVELSFILEVENKDQVETVDADGQSMDDTILLEEFVLFYNPNKSTFDPKDYLVTIAYDPKKGLSREFLAYFASFLNETATQGLDDLMDFLEDEDAIDFEIAWNHDAFASGISNLDEKNFFPYPRY